MQHIGKTLATTPTASTLFQKLRMPSSCFRIFPGSQGCKCYKVGPVLLIYLHTHLAGVIPAITAPSISTVESVEPKYTVTVTVTVTVTLSHWLLFAASLSLTVLTVSLRSPLLRCRFAHRSYGVASLTASGSVGVCPSKVHVVFFALLRFRFRFRLF